LDLLLTSCFTEAGFTRVLRPWPAPSSPESDAVELTASNLKGALQHNQQDGNYYLLFQ